MTKKLYYIDAYIKEFDSIVVEVIQTADGYLVELMETAFFPEEGGQTADKGTINGMRVIDVIEKNGTVYHKLQDALVEGEKVHGIIDFEERFIKMQCHTAEHIVCGIIHRMFGFDNVGFHLGCDEVTFDVSGELTREQLDEVELLANRAVFDNVEVITYFPNQEHLKSIQYRAKLDITEGVRIVEIKDYDVCACCAPHVSRTGEIGLIKLLDFMRHRGGTRIHLKAGYEALYDYREKYKNVYSVSGLLSAPQTEITEVLKKYISDTEKIKYQLKQTNIRLAKLEAEKAEITDGNAVFVLDNFDMDCLREFINCVVDKIGGIAVALCGVDGDYKYVIGSKTVSLREKSKEINTALCGKGGGRPEMIQGSFSADLDAIRNYFT